MSSCKNRSVKGKYSSTPDEGFILDSSVGLRNIYLILLRVTWKEDHFNVNIIRIIKCLVGCREASSRDLKYSSYRYLN